MRLTAINDIHIALEAEDFEEADRLGVEFSDYLWVLHDDLRWGDADAAVFQLTAPYDVLRRAFARLREHAETLARNEAAEVAAAQAGLGRLCSISEACAQVLDALPVESVKNSPQVPRLASASRLEEGTR